MSLSGPQPRWFSKTRFFSGGSGARVVAARPRAGWCNLTPTAYCQ
jgi:hypothetical protein